MFDLSAVQAAIREVGFDGWLLYDFRGLNVLARRVAGPRRRSHAVAPLVLLRPGARASRASSSTASNRRRSITCPGSTKTVYLPLAGTRSRRRRSRRAERSASRWSTRRATPTRTSRRVDAGTVELVQLVRRRGRRRRAT